MTVADPKHARRVILTVLYESYQRDPMFMMTPSDMADASALLLDDLAPNCHYLHERELIEDAVRHSAGVTDVVDNLAVGGE